MIIGIVGLLISIIRQPAILTLIINFILWFKNSSNGNNLIFIKAMTDAYAQVNKAQSVQEKQAAAEALSDLVRSIRH